MASLFFNAGTLTVFFIHFVCTVALQKLYVFKLQGYKKLHESKWYQYLNCLRTSLVQIQSVQSQYLWIL